MKTAVVTGANGFVGRNLVKKLTEQGVFVYAVLRNREYSGFAGNSMVEPVYCEGAQLLQLPAMLAGKRANVFYHMLWQGAKGAGRADYNLQAENAKIACDALQVCAELGCDRMVMVGTITERLADKALAVKSTAQNLMYGLTKSYTHKLLNVLSAVKNVPLVWAQLSNIYGGDDDSGNLISYTIGNFGRGAVPAFGPCEDWYDFVHIDDVCAALYTLGAVENVEGEYFIGRCENKKLKDYILELSEIYNSPVNIGARPDDGLRYDKEWFDNSRLVEELGFHFQYTFEEGIRAEMKKGGN